MATNKGQQASPAGPRAGQFSVYQNPALARIFTAQSLKPNLGDLAFTSVLFLFSSLGFFVSWQRRHAAATNLMGVFGFEQFAAETLVTCAQALSALTTLIAMAALYKALRLHAAASFRLAPSNNATTTATDTLSARRTTTTPSSPYLTDRQRVLLGAPRRLDYSPSPATTKDSQPLHQRPPKHKQSSPHVSDRPPTASSPLLAPLHPLQGAPTSARWPLEGQLFLSTKGNAPPNGSTPPPPLPPIEQQHGQRAIMMPFTSPPPPPSSSLRRRSPSPPASLGRKLGFASSRGGGTPPPIDSEESLESFLAEVDYRMMESASADSPGMTMGGQGIACGAGGLAGPGFVTPPPSMPGGGGIGGRGAEASGATPGSAPGRSFQVSPSAQKVGVSPKKREGGLPPPLSPHAFAEELRKLGVDLHDLEAWRDRLRQWMSEWVLRPLLAKILSSPTQVMETTAKLGLQVTLNSWGAVEGKDKSGTVTVKASVGGDAGEKGLLQGELMEEDLLLQRLKDGLVHERDAPPPATPTMFGLQSAAAQQKPVNPVLQQCLEAVMEHQRLRALLKGEWAKGLLPQSSVPIAYTIQRIAELAEGTCVRNYEWAGGGSLITGDKTKKWTSEWPTDSHLLLYLFAALLEHPKWILHQSDSAYSSGGSSPLFIASLPPKVPEKYLAVLPSAPPTPLNAGACILAVNKAIPPLFALYWDKKAQLAFQGRAALWDAILLFVHRIKIAFGGTIRGVSLGSPSLGLLDVLEPNGA